MTLMNIEDFDCENWIQQKVDDLVEPRENFLA